jgi:hypothetical protein
LNLFESWPQTSLVRWVAESDYGYPTVLTLHSIGMALVVGIVLMIDLRIVGFAKTVSLTALRRFFFVMWIGFAINLVSGSLLFLANHTAFLHNTAFLTKLSLLIVGAIATAFLSRDVAQSNDSGQVSPRARVIAAISIAVWLGAITAGRIVGYTSVPE